jgi:Flp pilus assembly protein TadG
MSIRSFFQAFLKCKRGNVAPIFALAIIPVVGLTGAAIDYSRANSIKVALQAALDATALAMAKSASTLTSTQLQQQATNYFNAVFNRPEANNVSIVATYSTTTGTQLTLTAGGSIDTTFTRVMGINQLSVGSSSTIKWGNQRLRVALVLDTTGSMAQSGKIGALQPATKNLLDQLKAAATNNGDVYVSIVPFSRDMNVGASNYNATWLQFDDGTDASWDGTNGTCSRSGYSPRSVCQAQSSCSLSGYNTQNSCTAAGTCSLSGYNTQSTCTNAGACSNGAETTQSNCTTVNACSKSQYTNKNNCTSGGGTWGLGTWTTGTWTAGVWNASVWTPNNHNTWNGCVTDRGSATAPGTAAGNDQRVTLPTTSDPTTLFYPDQYSYCSPALMGLSYDWTTMKSLVDGLYPNGSTNQPIGLVWGWQSLVGGGPLTAPPQDPNYNYSTVIILLTDGLNTQDRWYGNGSSTSTQVDNRMYASGGAGTCKNIKDTGITIYTIQVNTDGDPLSTLLQNCATTGKFTMLTTASQIVTTFNQIGTQLSQLRIAQ